MKTMQVELPDKLAQELDTIVQAGWFHSASEVVRRALVEFIRHHRFELLEQFQRDDIAWALRHKGTAETLTRWERRPVHRIPSPNTGGPCL